MVGGMQAPEGKSEPSNKCIAIDLEMKTRTVRKHEGP
jgi:hypothetical protein